MRCQRHSPLTETTLDITKGLAERGLTQVHREMQIEPEWTEKTQALNQLLYVDRGIPMLDTLILRRSLCELT